MEKLTCSSTVKSINAGKLILIITHKQIGKRFLDHKLLVKEATLTKSRYSGKTNVRLFWQHCHGDFQKTIFYLFLSGFSI